MTQKATWVFTQTTAFDSAIVNTYKFKWWIDGSYEESGSGKGMTTISGQYPKTGSYTAKLLIGDGDTIACAPALQVVVAPITDCECTAAKTSIDHSAANPTASWTISGCQSILGISSYTWSSDVQSSWATATAKLSSAGESVTPTVEVENDNGSYLKVTCQTVTAY